MRFMEDLFAAYESDFSSSPEYFRKVELSRLKERGDLGLTTMQSLGRVPYEIYKVAKALSLPALPVLTPDTIGPDDMDEKRILPAVCDHRFSLEETKEILACDAGSEYPD